MEVEKGVVDVASFSSDYPKIGFDLVKNTGTFYFGVPSPEAQARIFFELRKKFPQLDAEYSQYGKLLANDNTLSPQLLMTRKPVRNLQDFKGLKIKTIPAYISLLKDLGAEAVMMSMFDVYLAIQKGTIDGLLGPWDVYVPLKIFEVTKSVTLINLTYAPQWGLLMGWMRWNSLPQEIQKVFENNMKFYSDENLKGLAESRDEALAVAKKVGAEIIELSREDMNKVGDFVLKESTKKASELDAKGLPGTVMLNETRRLIKEYK
jgi:TRAP-type C4-dicarboxylate transport system substrate-binding protein